MDPNTSFDSSWFDDSISKVAKSRAPENMTIPVSNNVPVSLIDALSSAPETLPGIVAILPIHPSNPRLFPNLTGIWKNFQVYKLRRAGFRTAPLSSTLQSGAYAISTIAGT